MAGAEHEAVAVDPARLVGIEDHRVAIKHRADFRAAERKPEMAGLARMHGVHGEPARFVCGAGESCRVHFHKWGAEIKTRPPQVKTERF